MLAMLYDVWRRHSKNVTKHTDIHLDIMMTAARWAVAVKRRPAAKNIVLFHFRVKGLGILTNT